MNTLWALLLVTSLNGQVEAKVVDYNLTVEDCFRQASQEINLPGGNFVKLECKLQPEEFK
jgi:hypothetical protein